MRRILMVAAIILAAIGGTSFAQTCPEPVITQIGGANPSCPNAAVTLDAGAGWTTYEWSTGATTRVITDAPSSTTMYTVTTTDANGCRITSQPMQLTVSAAATTPTISLYEPTVCPSSTGYASVPPPASGNYTSYEWTITNGTITYGTMSSSVSFTAGSSGPVGLTVNVTDDQGCHSTATASVPLRSIDPPSISLYEPTVCPGSTGYASVTYNGTNYSQYEWTITNGAITYGTMSSSVSFTANGSGPVGLTLNVTDDHGCHAARSVSVPLRSLDSPPISLDQSSVCPGSTHYAYVPFVSGTNYSSYEWTITNGTIQYGTTSSNVSYTATGNGPVGLTVTVTDDHGCRASNSVSVSMRTLDPPSIQTYGGSPGETAVCPGSPSYASVNGGPYATYAWTIVNGTIQYGADGSNISYVAGGQGPVTLTATVTDNQGCQASASATVQLKTITPDLLIQYTPMQADAQNSAYVPAPPTGSYANFQWTISGGTFDGSATSSYVYFHAGGSGPVTVGVSVTDDHGCSGSNSAVIPLGIATPATQVGFSPMCTGVTNQAWIGQPPNGHQWTSYQWSIANGTFTSSTSSSSVSFTANGGGPVTVGVDLVDDQSQHTHSQTTVPLMTAAPPINVSTPTVCAGGYGSATITPVPGRTYSYYWSVTHAQLQSWPGDSSASFRPDGSGPVTISVNLTDNTGCSFTSTAEVPLKTITAPAIQVTPNPLDPNYYSASAQLDNPDHELYSWVEWSAQHGTVGSYGDGHYVSLYPDHTGPMVVTAIGHTAQGCAVTSTKTLLFQGEPLMIDAPASFCSTQVAKTASLASAGTLSNIQWSATNATITSGANAATMTFVPNSFANVTLSATATDSASGAVSAIKVVNYVAATTGLSGNNFYDCTGGNTYAFFLIDNSSQFSQVAVTQSTNVAAYGIGSGNSYVSMLVQNPNLPLSLTITATTPDGCQATASATVRPLSDWNATVSVDTPSFCPGSSAPIHATVTNVQPNTTYWWFIESGAAFDSASFNVTSVTFHPTGTGDIRLKVQARPGSSGCWAIVNVTVPAASATTASINTSGALCPNGNVTLTASNGTSYLWSTGATTQSIAVAAAGTYSVDVTSSAGCVSHASINVAAANVVTPTITASGPTTFCAGGSVTLTASSAASYSWSTGATSQSITVGLSGNYSVTVTDANGCAATSAATAVTMNQPPVPIVDAGGPTTFCAGGSVTLSAPAGMSAYSWSTGATTRGITVNASGNYSVSMTDTNGCSATSGPTTVTVYSKPPTPTISYSNSAICPGGSVRLTASPSPGGWLWSTGSTNQFIDVTTPGTYSVVGKDSHFCPSDSASAVVPFDTSQATITPQGPTTFCTGGSVTLIASGNQNGTYLWSTGSTSQSITVTQSGNYTVTLTSPSGCVTQASRTVTVIPPVTGSISPAGTVYSCGTGFRDLTVTAGGGSGSFTYQWYRDGALISGQTSTTLHATQSGVYKARITDSAGCIKDTNQTSVFINSDAAVITPATYNECSAPNVLTPFSAKLASNNQYSSLVWSTGSTNPSTYLGPGTYTVTITDTHGCAWTSAPLVVTYKPLPQATITGPNKACTNNPTITLNATDDAPAGAPRTWTVYPGTILSGQGTQSITFAPDFSGSPSNISIWYSTTGANGCTGGASKTMQVSYTTAPPVITAANTVCPTSAGNVASNNDGFVNALYRWTITNGTITSGATTRQITYTAGSAGSTTLTLDVTLNGGDCVVTNSKTVAVNAAATPTITPSGPTTFCAGGSVTLTSSAASSYHWSNGATTQSITVSAPGSYSVTINDANGCSATSAAVAVDSYALPPKPSITADGPTSFCPTGSVHLSAPAGYSYLWSNGATTQTIEVTTSGSFTVTVTDVNGCSRASDPVSTTRDPDLGKPTVTAGTPTSICPGGSVSVTAHATGGSGVYSYQWYHFGAPIAGATAQTYTVSPASNDYYYVVVTDSIGCTSTTSDAVIVTVNSSPDATMTAPAAMCEGSMSSASVPNTSGATYNWTITGGVIDYTMSFGAVAFFHANPGATTVTLNATVTTAAGCSAGSSANVAVNPTPATPAITPSGPATFCTGGSVTLTAPAGLSYLWSNGATTQSIAVNASGSYSVTVTNANGCSAMSAPTTVTVHQLPATPAITAGGPTTFCAGGSVTLSAPAGYSYAWSTGATTQSIAVNASGSYSVTVTDANGCSAASAATSVTVNAAPATPSISASGPTTFCAGGSVTLTAPAGYSYAWSTGATTQSIAVNASGSYSVTVTNANGCSAASTATSVTVNAAPATPTITPSGSTTFCTGGSVTLSAPAGFTYLWSTGAATQSIAVNAAGSYSVTVTNANGCSATSAATAVTVNAAPATPTITPSGSTTFCAGGSVTLTAPAGFTYLWSTGATTQSIAVNASGSYTVTVTNASGCSATSAATSVTVNAAPATPTITPSGSTTFCTGGSVTLTAPAGFTYLWSTGAATQSIAVNAAGSYSVTVTNANGCSATSAATSVTVNAAPATPTITPSGSTTFCAGGSVTLTAPAGFTYLWSTGATTQSIAVNASGSYTVTVTNASGCSATSAATSVTVNAAPATPTITPSGSTTFCTGGSVTLTAPAGFTYLWSTGATTQSIAVNASGLYSVTVTNANGCSATSTATPVTVNAAPATPAITPSGSTTFCAGGSVTLTAPSGFAYSWSTGATSQSIVVGASGSYTVTVTNASGCSATSPATVVTVNAKPATPAITPSGATTFCAGGNVTLTAPSGFTYSWSTGATSQSIAVSASGSYSVTVTNASSCSSTSAPTTVTVNPATAITAGPSTTTPTVGRNQNAVITVTATGTGTLSYQWYQGNAGVTTTPVGANSSTLTIAQHNKGTYKYWVRVTGSCGTANSTAITITVN